MKQRKVRPPDIVLPPPLFAPVDFTRTTSSSPTGRVLRSPAPVRTPLHTPTCLRRSTIRRSSAIAQSCSQSSMNSPVLETSNKRTRVDYSSASSNVGRNSASYFPDKLSINISGNFNGTMNSTLQDRPLQTPIETASDWYLSCNGGSSSDDLDTVSEPETPEEMVCLTINSVLWTPKQDSLLLQALEIHVNDPRTAPFVGEVPPPALLRRIAKTTIKLAGQDGITFPYSRRDIRKRIACLNGSSRDRSALASPVLRDVGSGPIRQLTALAHAGKDFHVPRLSRSLKSPFTEGIPYQSRKMAVSKSRRSL
ncbi:uncharacterized protein V1516DRAFT_683657 [Lipomyces oligophaga]|uniref:uncharacterized protein n=1 Tax=Lipomyces oligophaga TaxID=45792 RepID=UPI0034CD4422